MVDVVLEKAALLYKHIEGYDFQFDAVQQYPSTPI